MWILSSIVFQRYLDKRYERDDYIPLHQDTLRDIVSKRKLSGIIADLVRWEFIEKDGSWKAGVRSMGYRLCEQYRRERMQAYDLEDKAMLRRVLKFLRQRWAEVLAAGPGYAAVQHWLHRLRIDHRRAGTYIRNHYPLHSDEYTARFIAIDQIRHGQFFFIVDQTAGRAHHNLSNLASDLRRFLTVDGLRLVQVDIANSQPLFLYLTVSTTTSVDPVEEAHMAEVVLNGTFYETLQTEGVSREQTKIEVFRDVLFGPGTYSTPTTERFGEMFPGHDSAIRELKVPDFRQVPISMQRLEAQIVYEAVERFAATAGPTAPILTIHDSLVTIPEHAELARDILGQVFRERYGISPTMRIELF